MGQVCGAPTDAAVTLGLGDRRLPVRELPNSSNPAVDALQQLMREFESEFGAVSCKELLGCDIGSPESFGEAKRHQALSRCPQYVTWACDRLAEILEGAHGEM
jgi:Putative redox-active protein (C_GCAxxG_C_C)